MFSIKVPNVNFFFLILILFQLDILIYETNVNFFLIMILFQLDILIYETNVKYFILF